MNCHSDQKAMKETYCLLIVDDDEVDRMAARRAIMEAGLDADIMEACDVVTGIKLKATRTFDCIFLDYQLPDGDGLDLLQTIRSSDKETPVVMLTGHGDEQIAVQLMKAGATDYIAKSRLSATTIIQSLRYVTRLKMMDRKTHALEAQMEATTRLVQEMADTAPVLLWMSDQEGNFTFLNRSWLEFTGRKLEEELGTGYLHSIHPDDLPHVQMVTSLCRSESRNYNVEYRLRRTDGKYRWVLETGTSRLSHAGISEGYIGSCVDITERKVAEQNLLEKQHAIERLNQRLKKAMFETHHRVKNNLQIIAAMLDMQIMDNPHSVDTSELKQLATHIHVMAVVHNLLTRRAHMDGEADHVSVQEVLGALLPLLQKSARPCHLEFSIDDIELPTNQGTSLAIIANELLANAIKFGKNRVNLSLRHDTQQIALEVEDDGPGFPPDFDPQYSSRMGLELVLSLSRLDLNGVTRFENLPTGGARVCVTAPVPSPEQ